MQSPGQAAPKRRSLNTTLGEAFAPATSNARHSFLTNSTHVVMFVLTSSLPCFQSQNTPAQNGTSGGCKSVNKCDGGCTPKQCHEYTSYMSGMLGPVMLNLMTKQAPSVSILLSHFLCSLIKSLAWFDSCKPLSSTAGFCTQNTQQHPLKMFTRPSAAASHML